MRKPAPADELRSGMALPGVGWRESVARPATTGLRPATGGDVAVQTHTVPLELGVMHDAALNGRRFRLGPHVAP